MELHITSGDCVNEMMHNKGIMSIPFNEAMERGPIVRPLFGDEFIKIRSQFHNVPIALYQTKLSGFLSFLKNPKQYDELVLWFGEDHFCLENVRVLFDTLKEIQYDGHILYHTINEETLEILYTKDIILNKGVIVK